MLCEEKVTFEVELKEDGAGSGEAESVGNRRRSVRPFVKGSNTDRVVPAQHSHAKVHN